MIKALEGFDKVSAAGLLARTALSLSYDEDLTAFTKEETRIRSKILGEARLRLGIPEKENRPQAIEKIADFLDGESEKLLGSPNTKAALARLAERGDLPSDLYDINVIPNVAELYGRYFSLEKQIIETTIREPLLEQHFGPPTKSEEPATISLFARPFRTRWLSKDFLMLVAGQRDGLRLHIHQAWRIYSPSRVNLTGAKTLVDWLSRFADAYGANIEVGGKKGHFFLFVRGAVPNKIKLISEGGKRREVMISRFVQKEIATGIEQSALVVAIDLHKYLITFEALRVHGQDMLEKFIDTAPSFRMVARRRTNRKKSDLR